MRGNLAFSYRRLRTAHDETRNNMAPFRQAHQIRAAHNIAQDHTRPSRRGRRAVAATAALAALVAACGSDAKSASDTTAGTTTAVTVVSSSAAPTTASTGDDHSMDAGTMMPADQAAAMLATAGFQDVETAEAAGYASTIDALGCFENPDKGGMGVHYLNDSLMDATVDIATPEALVYELDAQGKVAGLVAHEYIVPIEAWTAAEAPTLFGVSFHQHPVLPLWVLHTWLWKENPTGMFQDWNPAIRLCPADVPIFDSAKGGAGDPHD